MIRWMRTVPKKWAFTAVAVVAAAAVAGAGYSGWLGPKAKQGAAPQQQQQQRAGGARQFPVETQVVKMAEVSGGQVFSGSISPQFTTNLSAKVTGRVTDVMVKVGDRVKVGQPLAKIDTSTLEQTLASTQADLAASEASYQKAVSDQANSVATAEKNYALQQANYEKNIADQLNNIASLKQQVAISQANYNKAVNDQQNAIAAAKQAVAVQQQNLSSALATYNTNLTNALNSLNAQQDSTQTTQVGAGNNLASLQLALQQAIKAYDTAIEGGRQSDIDNALAKLQSAQLALDQAQQTTPSSVVSAMSGLINAQNALATAQNSQTVQNAQENLNQSLVALTNAQNTLAVTLEQSKLSLEKDQQSLANAEALLQINQNISKATLAQSEQALQNAKSTDSLAVSKAQLEQKQVSLSNLMEQLKDGTLLSPVDGIVTAINTPIGQNAGNGSNIMTVAAVDPILATVNVSEANIGKMKVGMEMKVNVPTLGKTYDGVISAIRPTLDATTKSYGVDIKVNDPKGELLPGMFATSSMKSEGRTAIMVPADAVLSQPSGNAVFVVQDGRAKKVSVKVGTLTSSLYEIVSGLKEGDELVVKGQELLSDKAAVQVVKPGQEGQQGNRPQGQQGQSGQGQQGSRQQGQNGQVQQGEGTQTDNSKKQEKQEEKKQERQQEKQAGADNSTGGQRGEGGQRSAGAGSTETQPQRAGAGQ
ncbi:efflux RND transporter periplasmic adaptor subunit [Paenibacillus hamazuiensis]|uniref:efflux RND transporter periplasmic adaptor subunit n=1 Tax=Paenibacillus hamazuiensis TaxID=2936508 RepID=UPI00200C47FE|nr:efflux RND transporter periplasmic adaptor subunit [Paenibacillus hamazuiensis]